MSAAQQAKAARRKAAQDKRYRPKFGTIAASLRAGEKLGAKKGRKR